MYFQEEKARDQFTAPADRIRDIFGLSGEMYVDAEYFSADRAYAVGITGIGVCARVMSSIMSSASVADFLDRISDMAGDGDKRDGLFLYGDEIKYKTQYGCFELSGEAEAEIRRIVERARKAPGVLGEDGEHIIDLKGGYISTHFRINLLIGNRIGYENPLLTTPKATVNEVGGGSFRADAAEQVLATRCVMDQDQNGEPANRQLYIVENNRQIFYSANAEENVKSAYCRHYQNYTVITYETECGLRITRTIFILPQTEKGPVAAEVQRVKVENLSGRDRKLKIVMTGMFGEFPNDALANDIVYCNIVHESEVMKKDGRVWVITPHDFPSYRDREKRFAAMISRGEGMDEYSVNYRDFIGDGTLQHPQNVAHLPSRPERKAAPFFAMGKSFVLKSGEEQSFDELVGMVKIGKGKGENVRPAFHEQVSYLLGAFADEGEFDRRLDSVKEFYRNYSSYIKLQTDDALLNSYINNNLPFQVFYQSFVSRSFAWTQKAHRQIGFREIQDMFASMYYMCAMGESALARDMISQWAKNIYKMGYANHNFYFEGKEPGQCSDDQLWIIQAVYRYCSLTGDYKFLDEIYPIAGGDGERSLFDTLFAAVRYSGEISVGDHGLPLLDSADWNDCLKLDSDWINGPEKEKRYMAQLEADGTQFGVRFKSSYCESVMNAFLLRIAEDELCELAELSGRSEAADKLREMSRVLGENIQRHTWKENFFCRALINSPREGGYTYVGAKGDRLSADENIDGSYFLNSFSWSLLSGIADEEQIREMLGVVNKYLKTKAGYRLSSPCDLDKISSQTATDHYFPGDRENGAVFKHATMMATSAMFKAAKEVCDEKIAEELAESAYWMLDKVYPYKTMENPFVTMGNPRFCTQYNNSETLENVGPMLSGTASWLSLTIFDMLGITYSPEGVSFCPVLPSDSETTTFEVNRGGTKFVVTAEKNKGFARPGKSTKYYFDGKPAERLIPDPADGKTHSVRIVFDN